MKKRQCPCGIEFTPFEDGAGRIYHSPDCPARAEMIRSSKRKWMREHCHTKEYLDYQRQYRKTHKRRSG